MVTDTTERGCDTCRAAVYRTRWEEALDQIAVEPNGPAFLHRCRSCGSYWDVDLRKAVPISEVEARRLYPHAFGPRR